jgi:hypothetical protein
LEVVVVVLLLLYVAGLWVAMLLWCCCVTSTSLFCLYTHTHTHTYIHTYIHSYTHTHTHIHTHTHTHAQMTNPNTPTRRYIYFCSLFSLDLYISLHRHTRASGGAAAVSERTPDSGGGVPQTHLTGEQRAHTALGAGLRQWKPERLRTPPAWTASHVRARLPELCVEPGGVCTCTHGCVWCTCR